MPARIALLLVATLACSPGPAIASDDIRWNGFLNVVGGISKEDPPTPTNPDRGNSVGGTDTDFSFDNESSAGLQATKPLDDTTSVTVQLLSKGSVDNYAARMQWLYLSHDLSDTQTLRLGKLGMPTYYFSDFLNVGYAYHWIRPSALVYAFDSTYTGIDYVHRGAAGGFDWSAEVLMGTQNDRFETLGVDVTGKNLVGTVLSVTREEWTGRLSHFTEEARITITGYDADAVVNDALNAVINNPATPALAAGFLRSQQSALTDQILPLLDYYEEPGYSRLTFMEAALRYETQNWFAMAEATRFYNDTYMFDDTEAGLITIGWRFNTITYHIGGSYYHSGMTPEAKADLAFSLQNPLALGLDQIDEFLGSAIKSTPPQITSSKARSASAGVVLETGANSLLKFQLDYLTTRPGEQGETFGDGHNMTFRTALAVTF
jgi:hypothetical protein